MAETSTFNKMAQLVDMTQAGSSAGARSALQCTPPWTPRHPPRRPGAQTLVASQSCGVSHAFQQHTVAACDRVMCGKPHAQSRTNLFPMAGNRTMRTTRKRSRSRALWCTALSAPGWLASGARQLHSVCREEGTGRSAPPHYGRNGAGSSSKPCIWVTRVRLNPNAAKTLLLGMQLAFMHVVADHLKRMCASWNGSLPVPVLKCRPVTTSTGTTPARPTGTR